MQSTVMPKISIDVNNIEDDPSLNPNINNMVDSFVNNDSGLPVVIHPLAEQLQPRNITIISDSKKLKSAIKDHDNKVIVDCLDSGCYGVNARDGKNNNTPCHLAVLENNKEAIAIFCNHGANINVVNAQDKTPLMLAIEEQASIEMIKCLLANNAEINKLNNDGYSALTFAIKAGNKELTKELIKNGADTNLKDNAGLTALLHAIKTANNLEIINILIQKCDNINQQDNLGNTALHLATQIKDNNIIDIIKLLLKNRANINAINNNGQSPIHYAYQFNNVELIDYLISRGVDLNATDNESSTIMHFLAKNTDHQVSVKLLEKLIELKVNVNILDMQNNAPLYYAIKNKNFGCINKLLNLDANIFIKDQEDFSYIELILIELNNQIEILPESSKNNNDNIINQTLLSCLTNIEKLFSEQYHHTTSITYFVLYHKLNNLLIWIYNIFSGYSRFKFDPSNKDDVGFCPIHIAIEVNNLDAINILLDCNIDINATDKNGRTVMHHAVEYHKNKIENVYLLNLLIEKKVNIDAIDLLGNTALFYATKNNDLLAIKTLLYAGANIELSNNNYTSCIEVLLKQIESEINKVDSKYDSIIDILKYIASLDIKLNLVHSVIRYGCQNIFKKLIELSKSKEIKINFEQPDTCGNTPLHKATYRLDENIAKLLISQAVNINAKNNDGLAPIHYAAKAIEGESFVKLLLDFCANVDVKDEKKRTALHYATKADNIETIKLLIEKGAIIDSPDIYNKTPLHFSVQYASTDAMKLLIEQGADISFVDNLGRSVFHFAIILKYKSAIKLLYEKSDGKLSTIDNEGVDHMQQLIDLL